MKSTAAKLMALLFVFAMLAAACASDDNPTEANETGDDSAEPEDTDTGGEDPEPADTGGEDPEPADTGGDEPAPTEELTASDVGVSESSIKIAVVIADLVGLRDIGFPLPDQLTNETLVQRYTSYFDAWNAEGGINGRTIEVVEISWDPLSPDTMQGACDQATLDEEVFMAINASGFSQTFIPCFTEDNDTIFLYGEVLSQQIIDAAPNRAFALNPTSEVAGVVGAQLAVDQGLIPEGSKVGIMTSNNLSVQAAGEAAEKLMRDAGYDVVTVEVNTLSDDNAAINQESASAAATFTAEGVDHAFVLLPFTQADGFWGEVAETAPSWKITMIDSASSNCTPFGASRTNPAAEGAVCVTAYDSYGQPGGGIAEDDAFEAQCRQEWNDHFPAFEGKSAPGVPSGEVALEDVDGNLLYSDYAPGECTMMPMLRYAFENAGVNPTRDSFAEALKTYSGPQAFRSNGEGAFGADKNYYSTQMWAVEFTLANADTPRGDDGTYNGCPAPVNCWIPVTGEWFAIS